MVGRWSVGRLHRGGSANIGAGGQMRLRRVGHLRVVGGVGHRSSIHRRCGWEVGMATAPGGKEEGSQSCWAESESREMVVGRL